MRKTQGLRASSTLMIWLLMLGLAMRAFAYEGRLSDEQLVNGYVAYEALSSEIALLELVVGNCQEREPVLGAEISILFTRWNEAHSELRSQLKLFRAEMLDDIQSGDNPSVAIESMRLYEQEVLDKRLLPPRSLFSLGTEVEVEQACRNLQRGLENQEINLWYLKKGEFDYIMSLDL